MYTARATGIYRANTALFSDATSPFAGMYSNPVTHTSMAGCVTNEARALLRKMEWFREEEYFYARAVRSRTTPGLEPNTLVY